jgi:hypothetical protein
MEKKYLLLNGYQVLLPAQVMIQFLRERERERDVEKIIEELHISSPSLSCKERHA